MAVFTSYQPNRAEWKERQPGRLGLSGVRSLPVSTSGGFPSWTISLHSCSLNLPLSPGAGAGGEAEGGAADPAPDDRTGDVPGRGLPDEGIAEVPVHQSQLLLPVPDRRQREQPHCADLEAAAAGQASQFSKCQACRKVWP